MTGVRSWWWWCGGGVGGDDGGGDDDGDVGSDSGDDNNGLITYSLFLLEFTLSDSFFSLQFLLKSLSLCLRLNIWYEVTGYGVFGNLFSYSLLLGGWGRRMASLLIFLQVLQQQRSATPVSAAVPLMHWFILMCLDYCNSILEGILGFRLPQLVRPQLRSLSHSQWAEPFAYGAVYARDAAFASLCSCKDLWRSSSWYCLQYAGFTMAYFG